MQRKQQPTGATTTPGEQETDALPPMPWFRLNRRDVTITSLGEYFLPFFLAAMEACWFNGVLIGLAGLDFLQSGSALLPFWGPPLLLFTALLLFRRALRQESATLQEPADAGNEHEQRASALPGLGPLFGTLAVLTMLFTWLHIYSPAFFLFNPAWLLAFVSDLLALNVHFYQMLIIIAITIYFCWRGLKLAQLDVELGHVFRQIWIGLLVLLVAVLLRAGHTTTGGGADDIVLILLIPIFLYLSLSAHALARITVIRREHPVGLEGSVTTQERAMLSVISGVGVVLLALTILGGIFFSPVFFTSFQPIWHALSAAYNWLLGGFIQLVTWLLTPFFGLFNLLSHQGFARIRVPLSPIKTGPQHRLPVTATSPGFTLALKILLPLLLILALSLLLLVALRRRKRLKIALRHQSGDVHESLWSWQLFWSQIKALWWSFLRHLFPKHTLNEARASHAEEIKVPPAARTIREIYRALLKKAATRGHTRKRDETPHEFRRRLNEHETENEPQLGLLTDAYALTRYGGGVPGESELATLRRTWNELERKWET